MSTDEFSEAAALTATPQQSPFAIARARVDTVELLSPSFVRVRFSGDALTDLGNPGSSFDQRVKLIFPNPGQPLATLEQAGADWYRAWLGLPEQTRGAMRSYTIRSIDTDQNGATSIVIDFVLHFDSSAAIGPASRWASEAAPGDELLIIGPRRGRVDGGGIEYDPHNAAAVLLAGDETAAPAIASILEDADPGTRGIAFIEVPVEADRQAIAAPPGIEVRWLPRNGTEHGSLLIGAVLDHLGAHHRGVEVVDVDTTDPLWETPTFSGLGETVEHPGESNGERWFWIAGESSTVTTLRRHLVNTLKIDRSQVAFMGYWRRGVAMRG